MSDRQVAIEPDTLNNEAVPYQQTGNQSFLEHFMT